MTWTLLPQQQQRGTQIEEKSAEPEAVKEAHADGEDGKATARDATGAKQQGYADPADRGDEKEARPGKG